MKRVDPTAAITKARQIEPKSSTKPVLNTPTAIPEAWTAALFSKLQARYGNRWLSSYPGRLAKIAMAEWSQGLAGMTGEQIKRGLDTWDSQWPPSLPEFRAACRGESADWAHRGAAYRPFRKALPKPKANKTLVASQLAKMREVLRNGKPQPGEPADPGTGKDRATETTAV